MTQPFYYILKMLIILGIVALGIFYVKGQLFDFFMNNAIINGIIVGVLIVGILYSFRIVFQLRGEAVWLNNLDKLEGDILQNRAMGADSGDNIDDAARSQSAFMRKSRLLATLQTFYDNQKKRNKSSGIDRPFALAPDALQTVLDSVSSRLEESRDTVRYMVALLIFLGLLGTFWGLLGTLTSVSDVINSLRPSDGRNNVFDDLRIALSGPLKGMGTAFSSSLFGLAGSLILGFFGLQLGQAQNRFYNDLEVWLTGITRMTPTIGGGVSGMAYGQSILESAGESMEKLTRQLDELILNKNAHDNPSFDFQPLQKNIQQQIDVLQDILAGQNQAEKLLSQLPPLLTKSNAQTDILQNISSQLFELNNNLSKQNGEAVERICKDIRLLSKTISILNER